MPSETLSAHTADLSHVAHQVADPRATGDVIEGSLAALRRVVPYDLAAVYRLDGDRARVVAAAGPLSSAAVRSHELVLERFPTIRRALETRRPVALEEHDHASDEGDPYDGVLDLPPGHSCMVVPLFAAERSLGLITLDCTVCGRYPAEVVEIAAVYGQLISLALQFSDQAALLDRYRHQLKEQNRLLLEEAGSPQEAVATLERAASPAMQELARLARQVAASELSVLVLGETGTGKEVLARAIHAWSPRVDGPFVKLNCSAIPENLVESELFGHVKGAFSGASARRQGRFLTADGGTLLLDEIGDMPLAAQTKLLRVLQEGTFEPVGSDRTLRVDVRVIAATHADLEQAVAEGRFREDLYYRLAVFPLTVPPLRDRRDDLPIIAAQFLRQQHERTGRGPWTLPGSTVEALSSASWPGNVRQLINALERATLLQPSGALGPRHLSLPTTATPRLPRPQPPVAETTPPSWKENERAYLERVLERTEGKLYGGDGAAAVAQLKPTTLRSKLVKHGLR